MAVWDSASALAGLLLLCHTWGAWAVVEVNMEDRVEVFRGDTAQITCMFTSDDGIGGMKIMWLYVTRTGERQQIYLQDPYMRLVEQGTPFTDRISVNGTGATGELVLTITDVRLEDELEFICFINGLTDGSGEGRTKLRVFETPDPPTIEAVDRGISVNQFGPSKIGVCEVKNGYPKPNITWYRNTTSLIAEPDMVEFVPSVTTQSSGLFSVRSELNLQVVKEDKDAYFYCEVKYLVPGGTKMTETEQINITVYYPSTAVSVWVESPKGKIKEGDSVEIHCHGNGHNPSSVLTVKHEGSAERTLDNNMLVLSDVSRLHSGVYECVSMDMETYEEITGNTTVFVNFLDPAVVVPADSVLVTQGEELRATCNAMSSLPTNTVWIKDGKEISKGHILTLKDVTYDTAGTYVCVVTVPEIEGMETRGTMEVQVQGPPEIIKPDNTEIEQSFEKSVELICTVKGFPLPTVTWSTSDEKVIKPQSEEETDEGVQSVISLTVTSDITAFCNATNEYGADGVAFNIKATIHTTTQATSTQATSTQATSTQATSTQATSTQAATTQAATTTTTTTSTSTTISTDTVKAETAIPPKKIKKEGSGVIIAVIIICILLLAILGSVLYFLYKKGKICGRSGKQDLTKENSNKDSIVVEMKSDNTEEAILLGVNGEKLPSSDQ